MAVKLADYPGLARWHQGRQAAPGTDEPGELLVWRTCEALSDAPKQTVRRWLEAFRYFLANSARPLDDFLAAQAIVNRCDAELLDLIGELGEAAVSSEHAESFFAAMQMGADITGLVVLRFLSAWTALNSGDLARCVDECEKVDEPFGAIFTVHGQALLELGRAREACEVLQVAVKLAPGEVLAWFQLAKGHHVQSQCDEAFAALRECRRLAPQSDEVALYMGLVALDAGRGSLLLKEAGVAMRPALRHFPGHPTIVYTLMRLAAAQEDKDLAGQILAEARWDAVAARLDEVQQLTPVLRALHAAGWVDVAAQLLAKLTPDVTAA